MSIFHSIFHSCRRADELISQSMDEPLGWLDRLRMGVHLRMCGNCQAVKRQVETLHDLGAEFGPVENPDDDASFTIPSQPPRR
jgi:hypothetical protein